MTKMKIQKKMDERTDSLKRKTILFEKTKTKLEI